MYPFGLVAEILTGDLDHKAFSGLSNIFFKVSL
jgi:hypothetical protein